MKALIFMAAACSLAAAAQAEEVRRSPRVAPPELRAATPALADYTDDVLFGDVWRRPDLAPRDRSLVTVAALVAGGNTGQLTGHLNRALDNGVTPAEVSAVVTHLAFYAGWPRAVSASGVAKDVFGRRGIGMEQLTPTAAAPIGADPAAESRRAAALGAQVGPVAPALVGYTNNVLFGDLWRRPDLAPRDRSLVTIAALIAGGEREQLADHLERGLANGLTPAELSETITHLAFYAGWPRAVAAAAGARAVLEAQAGPPSPAAGAVPALEILRSGAQAPARGPAEFFTGTVHVDQRFQRPEPARVGGGIVSFEPGARTAWHTHPLGQTLIVTAGCGLVQREGGAVEAIRPGDVVWIPPGARHWHGATPATAMTHVAIAEALGGRSVDWMEPVTDEHYRTAPRPPGGC